MEQKKSFTSRLRENDQSFYGFSKDGQMPPNSLLVKHANGNQQAFSYQYLTKNMNYNPSEGIALSFCDPLGSVEIIIEGRNLQALWDQLHRHRVTYIEPISSIADNTPEDELCITEVKVVEG